MRCSSIVRKLSSDPAATHLGIKSNLWNRVRKALVVNPLVVFIFTFYYNLFIMIFVGKKANSTFV